MSNVVTCYQTRVASWVFCVNAACRQSWSDRLIHAWCSRKEEKAWYSPRTFPVGVLMCVLRASGFPAVPFRILTSWVILVQFVLKESCLKVCFHSLSAFLILSRCLMKNICKPLQTKVSRGLAVYKMPCLTGKCSEDGMFASDWAFYKGEVCSWFLVMLIKDSIDSPIRWLIWFMFHHVSAFVIVFSVAVAIELPKHGFQEKKARKR